MTQAQTAFFTAASLGLKNDKKRALNDVIRGIKETIDTKYADAFSVSGSTITFSGLVIADTIDVQTLNAANLQFEGNQTISGDFDITGQAIINERLLIGTSGSTANPAFSFNNDKNTGIYSPGADQFAISTGGSEAARIDSDGRVLVGLSTIASGGDAAAENASFVVQGRIGSTTDGGRANFQRASVPFAANARLGEIYFTDSSNNAYAKISVQSDGTPGAGDYPGRLSFFVTADGSASPTEALRITNDRYVRLASGSGGIQFNGDTAAANALDDYEEGTWTVEFYDAVSGGNQSATTATGSYTKVGRFVHLQFDVNNINTSGLTAVNQLFFSLPFVGLSSPFQEYKGACAIAGSSLASTPISTHLVSNSPRGYFLVNNAASGIFSNFQISSITSGANGFRASLSYMA